MKEKNNFYREEKKVRLENFKHLIKIKKK